MDIKELGEFGIIDILKKDTIVDPSGVVAGIGDDAAVLLPSPRQLQLITTDMLVEDVHFRLRTIAPWQLGYKALAVNISDIAAMGGLPRHAVISIAIPSHIDVAFVSELYGGMKEICREYGVNIVGGDTVSSPGGLIINAALLGEVEPTRVLRRSTAQIGDLVVVTGSLGNSGAGLEFLTRGGWEDYDFAWPLVAAHVTPRPQVRAGRALSAAGATSADDISDGLASEAHEIAGASQVGIRLYAGKIPLSPSLDKAAASLDKSPLYYALYGGEDYQLLATLSPDCDLQRLAEEAGTPLAVIGEVVPPAEGVSLIQGDGTSYKLAPGGYNHFR